MSELWGFCLNFCRFYANRKGIINHNRFFMLFRMLRMRGKILCVEKYAHVSDKYFYNCLGNVLFCLNHTFAGFTRIFKITTDVFKIIIIASRLHHRNLWQNRLHNSHISLQNTHIKFIVSWRNFNRPKFSLFMSQFY